MDSCASHSVELPANLDQNNHKLSYHNWRNELKKRKRKARRRTVAQLRDSSLAETNGSTENQNVSEDEENNDEEEKQRQLQNELWLEREKTAQAFFLAKKDREEKERQEKEDEQRKMKEEWEEQLRKQKELEEKQKIEKERMKEKMDRLQKKPTSDVCHNPPAPPNYNADNQEQKNCPFFQKVGACRFGLNCKRAHNVPENSTTLLFPGMFAHFEMEQHFRDEFDSDLTLEYEEGDIYEEFKDFYEDVFPEFQAVGRVNQFVVCCNYEPHLRGNVYAQYASKDEALSAYEKFNGRWYSKRQLSCQFTTVDNWKSAICGLFRYKKCPKGKNCNFLHVFQNPVNKRSENTSDFRSRTRRNGSGHEREHSQRRRNTDNRAHRRPSSSRSNTYTSSRRRSPSRSRSRSPSYPRHRRHQESRERAHQDDVDTNDEATSHRISRSSSRKRDRTSSSVSTSRRESSGSDSDKSERESSRRKHRKRSSRERRRGHSRKENTDADDESARRDKSFRTDSELGSSRTKTDVCLKETDLTADDESTSSSEILEDDGFGKRRNENGSTDRKSKRSKERRHSKKSKTKTKKKLKLG